jgi:hypothetical protein
MFKAPQLWPCLSAAQKHSSTPSSNSDGIEAVQTQGVSSELVSSVSRMGPTSR